MATNKQVIKQADGIEKNSPKKSVDNLKVKNKETELDLILELKDITKTFLGGKIVANDNVSLSFARNEVHAIVGENGSGKSTLMNIIFGLYKQDNGEIFINGHKVNMYHSGAAKHHKIGMVHQHFHLVDAFTVLENVILGQEELTKSKEEKHKIKELKIELKQIKNDLRALWKLDSMRVEPNTEHTIEISFEDSRLKIQNELNDLEDLLADKNTELLSLQTALKSEKERHVLFKKAKKSKVDNLEELMTILDSIHESEKTLLAMKDEILSLKENISRKNSELRILVKENSLKKKNTTLKLKETDTNFVAGVTKLFSLRHSASIEVAKEENIIKELKTERARLSYDKKHDVTRIEAINEEIKNRRVVIVEEKKAIELIDNYEHATVNEDQERVVKLAERQNEIERELSLLDKKLTGAFGKIKFKDSLMRLKEIQLKYNIHLDPYAKVSTLAVGQRQMVEILKVLWEEKDIIVFDEPTATLSVVEIEELLNTIGALKKEGKTIIFISHKLKEVKALADRVSVLRKGVMMGTYINDSKLQPADIGELMVGKTIELSYPERKIAPNPLVKVEGLSYRTHTGFKAVDNVSFEIYEGEIFGLAGIEGNGQEEIVKMLTDLRKPYKGTISLRRDVGKKKAKELILERAELEASQTLELASQEEAKLSSEALEKQIKINTKDYIREAELQTLDKISKIKALENPKASKFKIKELKHELKKELLLIKKNEHEEIKDLHSSRRTKEIKNEITAIQKVAKNEAKNIVDIAKKLVKSKELPDHVWDILTDSKQGFSMSGTERRKIQSHVPIDRLKHGVVPTKDLEFNAKIPDFDTHALASLSEKEKEATALVVETKYASIKETNDKNLVILTDEISRLEKVLADNKDLDSKQVSEYNKAISKVKAKKAEIENAIKHHDSRKEYDLSLMNNAVYNRTEKIINGMNVDGAFNHKVELRNLSGGNQQKFVVGREIFRDHKIFVAGHPTRGLDISAIDHIYTKMLENSEGKATLLYSLEINELLAVCDRVAVMYHGKIIDIVNPNKVTLEEVSRMMIGEKSESKETSKSTDLGKEVSKKVPTKTSTTKKATTKLKEVEADVKVEKAVKKTTTAKSTTTKKTTAGNKTTTAKKPTTKKEVK